MDLLGRRGAADLVPPLEDEDLAPRLREIRRAHQAVVPGADDDRVISIPTGGGHGLRFLSGSKNGSCATVAVTLRRSYSTVCSICSFVPFASKPLRTEAIAKYFLSSGDQVWL